MISVKIVIKKIDIYALKYYKQKIVLAPPYIFFSKQFYMKVRRA